MSDQHDFSALEQVKAPGQELPASPAHWGASDLDPQEYRTFVLATSGAVFRISPDWSQMRQFYGPSPFKNGYSQTEDWMAKYIPDADITRVRNEIQHAISTKSMFRLEHAVRRADGRYGWALSQVVPILNDAGELVEWLGTATDLDPIRALQNQQDNLLAELQHRVRNNLAVIRSIVRRTAANSVDTDEFSMHLDGRLASFARTQAAVSRDPLGGLDLKSVLLDELAALLIRDGDRAYVSGPDVILTPKVAETLALAFHELATNAVKFGALAVQGGVVRVSWSIENASAEQNWVRLVWNEDRAGVPLTPIVRSGFGLEFLENTLPYDVKASTEVSFLDEGLRCIICFDVDRSKYT